MALSLVTDVTVEPLTLEEAKAQCNIVASDDDDLLLSLITAARHWAEQFTHRSLAQKTWDLKLDGFPYWGAIEIPMPPVTAISSVSYVDTSGVTQTLALTTQYVTDIPAGPTAMPARVMSAYSVPWPSTRWVANAVTVRFTAGYTGTGVNATPDPIKQAMRLLISHWNENREAVVVTGLPQTVPLAAESLLWPFKVC
jgi:uncharacterized phiE125 gp8 family phage protein